MRTLTTAGLLALVAGVGCSDKPTVPTLAPTPIVTKTEGATMTASVPPPPANMPRSPK